MKKEYKLTFLWPLFSTDLFGYKAECLTGEVEMSHLPCLFMLTADRFTTSRPVYMLSIVHMKNYIQR